MCNEKRILIMEDSDIFADMLTGFLSSDYTIDRAVDGFEGIKKVYTFLPHLIITDVEMPVFKGYQVTRILKSRKSTMTIPVIMFTTMNNAKDKFWGNKAGADVYLEKSPDNFKLLGEAAAKLLSENDNIDFSAIERESRKINNKAIIEMSSNLLDNKLFQTTIIGMLSDLSGNAASLEEVAAGIFELLRTVCESEIVTMMIRGSKKDLYVYTANPAGFTAETTDNFLKISSSDFNKTFPGFTAAVKHSKNFNKDGSNTQKIMSYFNLPLIIGGEAFASIHIANSINEYFTPLIIENINVFFNSAAPVISNALSMHELSQLQKNTRIAFARYVPPDVMDEIINDAAKHVTASETRNISVMFIDIRNFTMLSEHAEAQGVVDFLNSFFDKMGSEIISEKGHIDKFIGDAIMAVFGAFRNLENSSVNAIRAALKMLYALEKINNAGNNLTKEKIRIGIGINCGHCILGNIGFKNKMDYTIIGDTVNLASRIESLTKQYRHPLIVSEYVYEKSKDQFIYRKIDNVRVIGKEKPVEIYAVYSGFSGEQASRIRSGKDPALPFIPDITVNREALANYNKGLSTFYMREWKLACEYFEKSLAADKDDFLSQLYLERSMKLASEPPPDNWDFVFNLLEK